MLGHGYYTRSNSTCYHAIPYYLGPCVDCEVVGGDQRPTCLSGNGLPTANTLQPPPIPLS
jgi:hypothetical protein